MSACSSPGARLAYATEGKSVNTITTEQLKERLDRGDEFKLLMAFDDWRFAAGHIPGSLGAGSPAAAMKLASPHECVVVYCTSPACVASQVLYRALEEAGYRHVLRYSGGVAGWQDAGHRLVGAQVG
jgi:rhodanese-related sulfurtransferase